MGLKNEDDFFTETYRGGFLRGLAVGVLFLSIVLFLQHVVKLFKKHIIKYQDVITYNHFYHAFDFPFYIELVCRLLVYFQLVIVIVAAASPLTILYASPNSWIIFMHILSTVVSPYVLNDKHFKMCLSLNLVHSQSSYGNDTNGVIFGTQDNGDLNEGVKVKRSFLDRFRGSRKIMDAIILGFAVIYCVIAILTLTFSYIYITDNGTSLSPNLDFGTGVAILNMVQMILLIIISVFMFSNIAILFKFPERLDTMGRLFQINMAVYVTVGVLMFTAVVASLVTNISWLSSPPDVYKDYVMAAIHFLINLMITLSDYMFQPRKEMRSGRKNTRSRMSAMSVSSRISKSQESGMDNPFGVMKGGRSDERMITPGYSNESMNNTASFDKTRSKKRECDDEMQLPDLTVDSACGDNTDFLARLASASRMAAENNQL